MNGIKFEKVSYETFREDVAKAYPGVCLTERMIKEMYSHVEIPKRGDPGSAGYDFHSTVHIDFGDGQPHRIVTGIKAKMPQDVVLKIYPRSGLGCKHGVKLRNTVGIIDSSYYNNKDNDGDIIVVLTAEDSPNIKPGDRFAQGIFGPYFTTEDDDASGERVGGFGSSGK